MPIGRIGEGFLREKSRYMDIFMIQNIASVKFFLCRLMVLLICRSPNGH